MLCALCTVCVGVDSGQAAGATVGLNTSNQLSTHHDLDRSEDGDDSTTVPFHDPVQRKHVFRWLCTWIGGDGEHNAEGHLNWHRTQEDAACSL